MKRFSVARLHHCSPVIFIILWPVISVNNFSWYFFTINQTPELQNLTLKQPNSKIQNCITIHTSSALHFLSQKTNIQ